MFFLIIHGTRDTRKPVGYVADFCPVCQEIQPFRLWATGIGDHLFYISLGQKKTLGHVINCSVCNVELPVDPLVYHGTVQKLTPGLPLASLIDATHPTVAETYRDELAAGQELRKGRLRLTEKERADALLRTMRYFNTQAERIRGEAGNFDGRSCLGCLGTIAVTLGLLYGSWHVAQDTAGTLRAASFVALIVGFILTLVLIILGPIKKRRKQILPGLVLGLDLYQPTSIEVAETLARARAFGYKIGSSVRPATLFKLLAEKQNRRD